MTDHEDLGGDDRGLSPPEVLATLVDGSPTEGDIRMLMELRVGLRAHPAGPAKVVADPGLEPLAPEMEALLDRRAQQRLRSRIDMKPPSGMPSRRTGSARSVGLSDNAMIGGDHLTGDQPDWDDPASEET